MLYYLVLDAFFRDLYVSDLISIEDFRTYLKNKRTMLFIQFFPFILLFVAFIIAVMTYILKLCDANISVLVILMAAAIMIILLPASLCIGFTCKAGRRMAGVKSIVLSSDYIKPHKAQLVMSVLKSSDLKIEPHALRVTIVCVCFPVFLLLGSFVLSYKDDINSVRKHEMYRELAQSEVQKRGTIGNFAAVLDVLRKDFDNETTYYSVTGNADYMGEKFLVIFLATESDETVYMAHFKVYDDEFYYLDYWVSTQDSLKNTYITEKADGVL